MNDKELEQLFEAKRTVEANRRRQEELRRLIAAEAAPKSRRLWPVWAFSAAASIALVLITLPALFRTETTAPVQVAQTEVPEATVLPATTPAEAPAPSPKQKTARKAESIETIAEPETIETIDNIEPIESIVPADSIETDQPAAPEPVAPRVHRRSSTLLACTEGCTIITVPDTIQPQSTDLQQLLADAFGSKRNEPLTLKTFEL